MTLRQARGSRETVWAGKYLTAVKDGDWEYAERPGGLGAVVIVAIDAGDVLLIEQYRVPAGCRVLELPAGLVGDEGGENIAEAAARELEEETGYRPARIEDLGDFLSSPGMTSERSTLVRATGLTRVGDGGGVGSEDIAVHRVKLTDVPAFVAAKRREGVGVNVMLLAVLGAGFSSLRP